MQVYNYFNGKGKCTPAVKRSIIESELIEEYHWLPQDIRKIPYKELQKFYIIRRQKNQTKEERQVLAIESASEASKSQKGIGGAKQRTKRIIKK
jgi:hypothetical protein